MPGSKSAGAMPGSKSADLIQRLFDLYNEVEAEVEGQPDIVKAALTNVARAIQQLSDAVDTLKRLERADG